MTQPAPVVHEGHVLRREFSLWSSFAFAFAFISPIVALYGIFGLAVTAAGPSFWWGFLLVFGGQLLVACTFAMLVSRWPLEGSIYQWSRRLLGTAYGWFAGWAYMWTLVIAMATVALGAAGFVANVAGVGGRLRARQRAVIALVILLLGTAVNLVGRQALKIFMTASIIAEVIGSLGLRTWLLLFHRRNDLSVLTEGGSAGSPVRATSRCQAPSCWRSPSSASSFVGFESAGAIAEEVHEPRKNLPKSVIFSLTFIAIVVMYSSLAIILAIPDLGAVAKGSVADPVYETLTTRSAGIAKPVELLFVIGFLASFLALQTSASRVIWSYARDGALPGLARAVAAEHRCPPAHGGDPGDHRHRGRPLPVEQRRHERLHADGRTSRPAASTWPSCSPSSGSSSSSCEEGGGPARSRWAGLALPVSAVATLWALFEFLNISWPRQPTRSASSTGRSGSSSRCSVWSASRSSPPSAPGSSTPG